MKHLKNFTLLLLITGLILILSACPYSSKVPIDNPHDKINKELIGKWLKYKDIKKKNPEYFQISDAGNNKYNIVKFEHTSSDSSYSQTKYLAHISKVENYTFFNMQKDGEGDYYLYKVDIQGNKFKLSEVTDNIDEKFNSSKDLKKFVKKYMHLSFFYNKEEKEYVKE